jgi:hypothetical protein
MKFLKPCYQLRLVLNLALVDPKDDIFIPKHFGINCLLLYVYDNVNMVGFNKNVLVGNTRNKQHELAKFMKDKKYE